MTEPLVEPSVPVPPVSKTKYPWAKMKDGDSFLVPSRTACKSAVTSFAYYKRTQEEAGLLVPFRLVTRSVGGGQYRVWLLHVED